MAPGPGWWTARRIEFQAKLSEVAFAPDPKRPHLPQLDRLTDDQVRAIMRAMDSMAE